MTDQTETENNAQQNGNAEGGAFNASVVAQYVKDLSFENPQVERLFKGEQDGPGGPNVNLEVEFNVGARRAQGDIFEVTIDLNAGAQDKESNNTIYQLEITYGGLFKIENIPQDALEPFLLVNCPSILFPFMRRMVADVTREGGYEPLMLDPIDFGQLYMKRKAQAAVHRES